MTEYTVSGTVSSGGTVAGTFTGTFTPAAVTPPVTPPAVPPPVVVVPPPATPPPADANVTVDFSSVLVPVSVLGVGFVISTYGKGAASINSGGPWKAALAALAPGHCRVPLRWNGGNPGSSAGGGQTSGDADDYVRAIKDIGAIPLVTFGGDASDNGFVPADGGKFVHHYNDGGGQNGGPVTYWTIGNEPDNTGGIGPYQSSAPQAAAAMHAADPTVVLSAPEAAYWDPSLLQWAAGQSWIGLLSYHAYNGGDPAPGGFPDQSAYNANIKQLKAWAPGKVPCLHEFNWHYAGGASQFFDWHNTCFAADVIGQVLSAGGHATLYSDANGPLGLMNDGGGQGQPGSTGTPLPSYWGLGIWTGMNGEFFRYGKNMCPASTTYPGTTLSAFASDSGKIVLVNKGTAALPLVISMPGKTTGTYEAWETNAGSPTSPVTRSASASYTGGVIEYAIPGSTAASVDVS